MPYLSDYTGWSMFVDSDFVFTQNIGHLFGIVQELELQDKKAMYCVNHPEYIPKHTTKFYDKPQLTFPKKNWSSLMIFNNEHPSTQRLTPESVKRTSPQWLHRFNWLDEETELGKLPITWNWLIGEYAKAPLPKGLHFTNGGPFNEVYKQDYEDVWYYYNYLLNRQS